MSKAVFVCIQSGFLIAKFNKFLSEMYNLVFFERDVVVLVKIVLVIYQKRATGKFKLIGKGEKQ